MKSRMISIVATVLLVFAGVGAVTLANVTGLLSETAGGLLGVIDRFGPPIVTALALSLQPWVSQIEIHADPAQVALRLGAWTILGAISLVATFRRLELGH